MTFQTQCSELFDRQDSEPWRQLHAQQERRQQMTSEEPLLKPAVLRSLFSEADAEQTDSRSVSLGCAVLRPKNLRSVENNPERILAHGRGREGRPDEDEVS